MMSAWTVAPCVFAVSYKKTVESVMDTQITF